ncbi:MAG: DUF6151 family protein [Pseudomonadota bacterium]
MVKQARYGFACSCKTVSGSLSESAPRSGARIQCFCSECRGAEVFAGQADPHPDPVDLVQMSADGIEFETGLDQLAVFSIGEGKILRWYASCCGAILFNTLRSPGWNFASIRTPRLSDPSIAGPVVARAFVPRPGRRQKHEGTLKLILGLLGRTVQARLTGRWRANPFFDIEGDGKPIRPVYVLTDEDRAKLPLERS